MAAPPSSLLIGKLTLNLDINDPEINADATLSFNREGLTYLEDLEGKLPAHALTQFPFLSIAMPTGSLDLEIETIQFSDKQLPILINGQATWHDAGISSPLSMQLGTLLLKLGTLKEDTQIHISDKDGAVKIDATLLVSNDGNYRINGTLLPNVGANQDLISTLSLMGKKDPQGIIHIDYMGML